MFFTTARRQGCQPSSHGKIHPQVATVRPNKVHRYRLTAVVPLPNKAAVLAAERDFGIDTLRNSRAFEDHIGTFGSNALYFFGDIVGPPVERKVGSQHLGDGKLLVLNIHRDHHADLSACDGKNRCR